MGVEDATQRWILYILFFSAQTQSTSEFKTSTELHLHLVNNKQKQQQNGTM